MCTNDQTLIHDSYMIIFYIVPWRLTKLESDKHPHLLYSSSFGPIRGFKYSNEYNVMAIFCDSSIH